jgi:hypothetical protein
VSQSIAFPSNLCLENFASLDEQEEMELTEPETVKA